MSPWLAGFKLDLRSLALGRILLGIILFFEFLFALNRRHQYYTEWGVLPRSALARLDSLESVTSLYLLASWSGFTVMLLLASLVLAVAFTVGWKTRWSTILLWVAVVSLQERNTWVLIGGDSWLRASLFWMMFLPIGEYFSLDRQKMSAKSDVTTVANVATVGFVLQVVMVYLWAGVAKYGEDWSEGRAINYILQGHEFSGSLANAMLYFPLALAWLTLLIPWLEVISGLALIVPYKNGALRILSVLCLSFMHIGIWLGMSLHHFSAIALSTLVILLPRQVWSRLGQADKLMPSQIPKGLAIALLLFSLGPLIYNPYRFWKGDDLSPRIALWGNLLGFHQYWQLFAPEAPKESYLLFAVAELKDGQQQALSYWGHQIPAIPGPNDPKPEVRLYRYWRSLFEARREQRLLYHAAWYSRLWRRLYPDQAEDLTRIRLYYQTYPVAPDYEDLPPADPVLVTDYVVPPQAS